MPTERLARAGRSVFMGRIMSIRNQARIALFAALIAVCAWITVPFAVPFTLQTFAIFLCVLTLGGKRGTVAILIYIALGAAGAPVFSGFRGGVGVLVGATGGYIWGFALIGACGIISDIAREGDARARLIAVAIGALSCDVLGALWYALAFSEGSSFISAFCMYSLPFMPLDLIKLVLAHIVAKRLRPILMK